MNAEREREREREREEQEEEEVETGQIKINCPKNTPLTAEYFNCSQQTDTNVAFKTWQNTQNDSVKLVGILTFSLFTTNNTFKT